VVRALLGEPLLARLALLPPQLWLLLLGVELALLLAPSVALLLV
jgi:hypothetical protein